MPRPDDSPVLPLTPGPVVLVVDDDAAARAAVCRMVRGLGYPARSCPSGAHALGYLQRHLQAVRVLLADVGMPGMDGAELAERARDLDRGLAVVLMVGAGEPDARELLAGYRDVPCLRKPVAFGELHQTLDTLVGSPVTLRTPDGAAQRSRPRLRSRQGERSV